MKPLKHSFGLAVFLFASLAWAAPNPAPQIDSVDFRGVSSAEDLRALAASSPWLLDIRQTGGTLDGRDGAWVAAAGQPYGQGSLILTMDRQAIPADLALTLIYEETLNGDFVVQLWDDNDRILAPDLFSNIMVAGREAKTDTFILDLARYPDAARVVLRRLDGEIRIYGLILSPVACEVPLTECNTFDLALQLDHRLTPASDLVEAASRITRPQGKNVDWETRIVQTPVDVAADNPFAREALAAEDYPEYAPSVSPVQGALELRFTASSLFAVIDMLRLLNAYHPQARGEAIRGLSSAGALRPFLNGQTRLCMMSIPMTVADRERFFRSRGYPVIELPAALDPILVVVHPDNPINELTIPQLDAIFGTELRSGAEQRILAWGDLGADGEWTDRPISLWGGSPQTGTSRLFRQFALQKGPLDPNLQNDPVSMYAGVLYAVARDPSAIGFLNAQHGTYGVKALAIAPQTGLPAYPPEPEPVYAGNYPLARTLFLYVDAPSPDQIDPLTREFLNILYSRSGQELFARRNQAPLPASQVREIRTQLGF